MNVSALGFERIVVQNDLSVNSKLFGFADDSCHQVLAASSFFVLRSRGLDAVWPGLFFAVLVDFGGCPNRGKDTVANSGWRTNPSVFMPEIGWTKEVRGKWRLESRLLIRPLARVPANHPLRKIRELVRDGLGELTRSLGRLYASEGRPSIPPEQLLSALLLQVFSTRSARSLCPSIHAPIVTRSRSAILLVRSLWTLGYALLPSLPDLPRGYPH